jgi:hypothetical protein
VVTSEAGFRVDPPLEKHSRVSKPLATTLWMAFSLIGSVAVHAQTAASASPSVSSPDYWLHLDTDLSVPRESLEPEWPTVVREPDAKADYSLANHARALGLWNSPADGHGMFNLTSKHFFEANSMKEIHPQIAFGSGDTLRMLLRAVGVNATCNAPAMRMHSNVAGSGPHTNVSLTARCSVH